MYRRAGAWCRGLLVTAILGLLCRVALFAPIRPLFRASAWLPSAASLTLDVSYYDTCILQPLALGVAISQEMTSETCARAIPPVTSLVLRVCRRCLLLQVVSSALPACPQPWPVLQLLQTQKQASFAACLVHGVRDSCSHEQIRSSPRRVLFAAQCRLAVAILTNVSALTA